MNAITVEPLLRRASWLAFFFGCTWIVAIFGGQFPPDAWYAALNKPLTTPPNWVFAIVWPGLYLLLAVAAWLIWDDERRLRRAHALWWLLLPINAAWPWVFFGLHRIDLAFGLVAVLLPLVAATMAAFWRIRPLAAALLAPYFAWLLFAAFLNAMFLALNG